MRAVRAGAAVLVGLIMILAGCTAAPKTLTVLAAASLTESFDRIIEAYRVEHPDLEIRVSYGSSATLAGQITSGAPADVFASANESTMQTVIDAGGAKDPRVLATNILQIAVPAGNPGQVRGLDDFARTDLRLALCAEEVPCGKAAKELFDRAGVEPQPDSYETDVKATLQKVQLGEVDAALVYRTDVVAAGDQVIGLETPGAEKVVNTYKISALSESQHGDEAAAFVDFVTSESGQAVLAEYGFGHG
ncbi:molybdate ABC transporter substrate-binding protein [Propionibacteriaceae bacterium Y1685]|uniref:molybdate ABC transporter substrate-binding protein n=1 Tax=Microlunatus sp. Y1700 TaxID=3418487 RepID=UPI003B777AAC